MIAARLHVQRGMSLIEALVALALMAFGMLGIVGVQSTLRLYADVAKQRSEAVRIAQRAIEDARSFTDVVTPATGYSGITTVSQNITGYTSNTTYSLNTAVVAWGDVGDSDDPRHKILRVTVSWADRTNATQSVELNTDVARIMPELTGTLALAGGLGVNGLPTRPTGGRNIAIPVVAVNNGDGTSTFNPASGVNWVFNNNTALIKDVGNPACASGGCFLLSGYIQFAPGAQPTWATAINPPGPAVVPVGVQVYQTSPTTNTVSCYTQAFPNYLAYYCAIAASASPFTWSGQSVLTLLPISSTLADNTASNDKVCRYTSVASDTPPRGNIDHPLNYSNVSGALINQNFLVISAGNGAGTAYTCPVNDGTTPYIGGTTYRHQPVS